MKFDAKRARVTGAMRIQDEPVIPAIHWWVNLADAATWDWPAARPGEYRVEMHYSLDAPLAGGRISIAAGADELVARAEPTASWRDFRTFDLGVIRVASAGDTTVVMRAIALPPGPNAAMPDVAWLRFTPTVA